MAKRSKQRKDNRAGVSTKSLTGSGRDWLWGLILLATVVLTYTPVWWAGFVWDDGVVVTANPVIVGPLGLKEIWTTKASDICPLTLSTFWLEHKLWGLAPLPYHLVNVFLQAASAVVLWRLLRRLLVPGAWLGAALWALHPVQVESVAWITELKNTESGFFFLLTILFFVKGLGAGDLAKPREWDWNYTLTLLFAALAMASKSSAVILPVVLCLCAWWVEVRWHWRNLARMVPIVLMSAVASAGTLWTQKLELATVTDPQWTRTWSERLATAGDAFWFYLGKLLWPHPIIAIYPRWQIDTASWLSYAPLVALLIVFVVLWSNRRSWSRPWFFVFAWFLATLLPVLGLVNSTYFYYSFVADHFQYLASMAPLAQAGTGLVRFADCVSPGKRWLPSTLAAGLLLLLAMLSWRRAWAFENDEVLWTDTLAKNPKCWLAAYNLGHALDQSGRIEQAIPLYRKALEIRPDYPQAHTNLGMALLNQGQKSEAMEHFQEAVKLDPNYSDARSNLGVCLAIMGKTEEAISQFQKALEIEPDNAEVQNNLGSLFLKMGQMNQAILHYQLAVQINPDDSTAQANLAKAQAALRAPPTHQPK